MSEGDRVVRVTTWIAGTVALLVAVNMPLAHFVVSYERIKGNLESEAEINARIITGMINANPALWRYQELRFGELLARQPKEGTEETRRILDLEGGVVAEGGRPLARPLAKATHDLKDAGVTVGRLEISRSLLPLVVRTGLVALIGLIMGSAVFIAMRVLPIRAVARAEEQLRRLNEGLELKVAERTKQLLEAQGQLVRKEKLAILGQLAGSVGHELRNPLAVMSNAVYFLQMVLPDADATVREYLGIIKSEILGAERIIGDLLDAVRTRPPQRQLLSAGELIRMSLERSDVPEDVTVDLQVEAQEAMLVDPLQMKQAFINLIANAWQAMPEGGVLKISARAMKGEGHGTGDASGHAAFIVISVADTGTGIPADDRQRLFQPLFTTKARGIGLGLLVVKNLTEANGGKVSFESEVGRGTTFTLTLPAWQA